jgi:hypothetical protein
MPNSDPRVPVLFAPAVPEPGDAVLVEGEGDEPEGQAVAYFQLSRSGHFLGCPCCAPRGPVVVALFGLFLARAHGDCAFFSRVIVTASPAGEAAVRQALAEDVFLAGRYRAAD